MITDVVLTIAVVSFIWCLSFISVMFLLLSDDSISPESKLENIQRINITLVIVVMCYICLFIGKVVL